MQVTLRYRTKRGAGRLEKFDGKELPAKLESLCRQRIEAQAEAAHGWVGEVRRDYYQGWVYSFDPDVLEATP